MTIANFMTRRRPANAETERHEQKPPDGPHEHKTDWKGYIMLGVGLLLFTIGGIFNNAPLKGQHKLLVATSEMPMKEFDKAVVFILAHNKGMARGLIVNMPGKKGAPGFGGPQERGKIFALHTLDVRLPETIVMDDVGLGLEEGKAAVDKIRKAKVKPAWYVVVDGYTGWSKGQMEQEMSEGDWELVEFDQKLLSATPPAKLWEATRQLPRFVMTH